ncbi:MAG: hypothetical protein ABR562_00655 [Thermoplasmatota archaeon]
MRILCGNDLAVQSILSAAIGVSLFVASVAVWPLRRRPQNAIRGAVAASVLAFAAAALDTRGKDPAFDLGFLWLPAAAVAGAASAIVACAKRAPAVTPP